MLQIEFRFLVCSYLPGVPFSLALYYCFIFDRHEFFILYIVLSPIFAGLFFDALRHFIESRHAIWCEPTSGQIIRSKKYNDTFLIQILGRSNKVFHIYEFFANLAISLFLTGALLLSVFIRDFYLDVNRLTPHLWWIAIIVLSFAVLSIFCARVFKREQDILCNTYFF
jgi:hypothetical protein